MTTLRANVQDALDKECAADMAYLDEFAARQVAELEAMQCRPVSTPAIELAAIWPREEG